MAENLRLVIEVDDKGSATVRRFANTVKGATNDFEKRGVAATGKMRQSVDRMGGSFLRSTKSIASMVGAMAGIALGVQSITAAASAAIQFQSAMANVSTLVDTSQVSMAGLRAELLKLPPELGTSTSLAKGLYEALSAGVEPAQAVAFVGDAAKLASAGLTETNTAVKILTQAMNNFGFAAEDAGKISDVLFTAVKQGQTTMDELANSIAVVFPLSKNLGVSFEETTAAVATLTKSFPTASQAATGFRSLLSQLIQNADKFREAGIDVQKVIGDEGLAGVMARLKTVTGGNIEEIRKYVSDTEGLNAVLSLTGALQETQAKNLREMNKAWQEGGATNAAFAKQLDTFQGAWKTLVGTLDRLVQDVAPPVLTFLTNLLGSVTAQVDKFRESGDAAAEFSLAAVGGLEAVVGALQLFIGLFPAVLSGWQRIGQGISLAIDKILVGVGAVVKGLNWIGVVSETELATFERNLNKSRVEVLGWAVSFGAAAEKNEQRAQQLSAAFDTLKTSIGTAHASMLAGMRGLGQGADEAGGRFLTLAEHTAALGASAQRAQGPFKTLTAHWLELGEVGQAAAAKAQAATQQATGSVKQLGDQVAATTTTVKTLDEAFAALGFETPKKVLAGIEAMEAGWARMEASGQATAQQLLQGVEQIVQGYRDAGLKVSTFWRDALAELRAKTAQTADAIAARTRELGDQVAASFRTQAEAAVGSFKEMAGASDLSARQIRDRFVRQTWPQVVAGGADMVAKFRPLLADLRDNARTEAARMAQAYAKAAGTTLETWRQANEQLAAWQNITTEFKPFATDVAGIKAEIADLERQRAAIRGGGDVAALHNRQKMTEAIGLLNDRLQALRASEQDVTSATQETTAAFGPLESAGTTAAARLSTAFAGAASSAVASLERIKRATSSSIATSGSSGTGSRIGTGSNTSLTAYGGFQYGGQFVVGGRGGPDSQHVTFRATPGEHVTVQPPGGQGGAAPVTVHAPVTVQATFHGASEQDARQLVQRLTDELRRAMRLDTFRT